MRILAWLLLASCLLSGSPVLAEDYTGSNFLLRDPFMALVGGYSSSSSFSVYSQTGARIESGYSVGSDFAGRSGTESYAHYTSPVITATAGDTEVDLSWTASQAYFGGVVSGYSVGVSAISGGPYTYTSVGGSLSTTVTGLTNSAVYYFVVKVNDANLSQNTYSAEVDATPVAAQGAGGGGGGGGGGSSDADPGDVTENIVNFSGLAFPGGLISVLKDGEHVADAEAAANAEFEFVLTDLSTGTYNFVIYGVDQAGRRSASRSFRVEIDGDSVTSISGVYLSPTLSLDKSQVKRNDPISVSGQTVPLSMVTILLDGKTDQLFEVQADTNGLYSYDIATGSLSIGDYVVKTKSASAGVESDFGTGLIFTVSDKNVPIPESGFQPADLNGDNRVNLVDFAIAGFWYKRELSATFASIEKAALNGDGKIDLTDFAIMAYYWSG